MAQNRYELLKERSLCHFEELLALNKIDYIRIGPNEYDFLSPTRKTDSNFGACRFNTAKGIGADFAGISFSKQEFEQIGPGFNKDDFAGFTEFGETKNSFDVIGLYQRICGADSYQKAAEKLKEDLEKIDGGQIDVSYLHEQIAIRHERIRLQRDKMQNIALRSWKYCRDIKGTIGENYLNSRGIYMQDWDDEPNMRFHGKIYNSELKMPIPAVIFKVSDKPDGELKAIHRVWIAKDGSRKARLEENKKAIGRVEGSGIWFGKPNSTLYVCEGPEEALTVRYKFERDFVVSTVYSTNYHSLVIPSYVDRLVLVPDKDDAGKSAATKAIKNYQRYCTNIRVII